MSRSIYLVLWQLRVDYVMLEHVVYIVECVLLVFTTFNHLFTLFLCVVVFFGFLSLYVGGIMLSVEFDSLYVLTLCYFLSLN